MVFQPGQSGNPAGRKPGTVGGRTLALQTLDSMLGEDENQAALRAALQKEFDDDPLRFFRSIIMPLLPKSVKMELGHQGLVKWQSILDIDPIEPSSKSTELETAGSAPYAAAEDSESRSLPRGN